MTANLFSEITLKNCSFFLLTFAAMFAGYLRRPSAGRK